MSLVSSSEDGSSTSSGRDFLQAASFQKAELISSVFHAEHLRDSREKLPLTNIRDLFSFNLVFKVSRVMAVGSTGVEERDGRTFGSQRVKICASVFATLIISVAVAELQFVAVRNGDKVTLPCGQQLPNCRNINWLFTGNSNKTFRLVKNREVSQQYVEEYGQLSLTSDCSLDIMKITEELVGQFTCRRSGSLQDLATIYLSVVSLTRTEKHQLSCSVASQDSCIYKVRWLYDGKPYSQPEPSYGCPESASICQDCEEPLQEELFSCEVWSDSLDDVRLIPLIHQTEGPNATTSTLTTRWPTATGSTGKTGGNSEEPQPGGWWRHLVAVLVVVVVMCILVDFLLRKRAKGKKKLQEENTVSEDCVFYTKRGAKVRVQVTNSEDGGEAAPSGGAADESTLYCNVSTLDG
ncbi:uncharacterized protein LOC142882430 isoform X2 [Nelusetta ayraudi]|uniref:uncharacterized protein LOC142882430 isoform X2 n=1 Tax=Nelusetta ayraudi TaxID=303726 RepID=UPI003F6EA52A